MHARIQIYWCRSSIFRHLKLELLTQFPASNDEKYINVVYIWRKFVSFYGYVHWRMTTEISVMYGSEKVKHQCIQWKLYITYTWAIRNLVTAEVGLQFLIWINTMTLRQKWLQEIGQINIIYIKWLHFTDYGTHVKRLRRFDLPSAEGRSKRRNRFTPKYQIE